MRAAPPLQLSSRERRALEALSRSHALPQRQVRRARIILLASQGVPNEEIARCLGCSKPCVLKWRARFEQAGIDGLKEARGRGRTHAYDQAFVDALIRTARGPTPNGHAHWSVRSLAAVAGGSPSTVHRILCEHRVELKPTVKPEPCHQLRPAPEEQLAQLVPVHPGRHDAGSAPQPAPIAAKQGDAKWPRH